MTDIYKWLFGKRGKDAMTDVASVSTLSLPDVLAPYADAIRATELPILAAEYLAEPPGSRTASQLGGLPWWPKDMPYPVSPSGAPLFLLAQIDLAELPPFEPLPRHGLLQFFIANDDLYGCNLDNLLEAKGFRCVLHEDTRGPQLTDFAGLERAWADQQMLPLDAPLEARALRFMPARMPVDTSDYRFDRLLPEIAADETLTEAYFEWKTAELDIPAIRIGGYPTFTQDDPRTWRDHEKYGHHAAIGDFTLLTVDTTDGIMWGDSGAAQFLAHASDIAAGDVSKVVYNWDCL